MEDFTFRVYLPDGGKTYATNDSAGDSRMMRLYDEFGSLKVEKCRKVFGKVLDDAKLVSTTTLERVYYEGI